MRCKTVLLTSFCLLLVQSAGQAADQVSLDNKSSLAINEVHLGKPNSEIWGPNQLSGEAPANGRATLTGVQPGTYDVKVHMKTGATCIIHRVDMKPSEPFSVSDSNLKECSE